MSTEQLTDIVADVENSILPENAENSKFSRIGEIGDFQETGESTNSPSINTSTESAEIPRALLWDENGNERVDGDGATFDPDKHATDDDGMPKLTNTGKLRKKRGRKSGSLSVTTASQTASKAAVSERERYKQVGASAANALVCLGMGLGGEDFAPIRNADLDERKNLEMAFTDWAETQEVEDIPPNLALCIVVGSYILPRLAMPRQVTKMQMFKHWLKLKFLKKGNPKKEFDPNKKEDE